MSFTKLGAVVHEMMPVAEAFAAAGFRVFLVGGVVRDLWLDQELDDDGDIDLTTDARPDQTKAVVADMAEAIWTQGERFGTIGCRVNGRDIEITTHRAEEYDHHSRKPRVEFAEAITADLSRRDFTVNAMAVELPAGELIDPFGGVEDLDQGRLRTPRGAAQSFTDDPLRMLRAARFAAGYALVPAPEISTAMAELSDRLEIVAVERIRDELDKLLVVEDPESAFLLLSATGVLAHVLPGLDAALATDDQRTLRLIRAVPANDRLGRLAALAWGDAAAHDPETLRQWARAHRYSREEGRAIERIVVGATSLGDAAADAESVRRWAAEVGPERGRALLIGRGLDHDAAHAVAETIERLEQIEDLHQLDSPLDGTAIMQHLGIREGRAIGGALDHLRELRLAQGPMTEAEAYAALDEWAASQPGE